MRIRFLDFVPALDEPFQLAPAAAVIGRTTAGAGLHLLEYATVRADGEWVRIGSDVFLAERATVHIADSLLPAVIGDRVTVGRYGLVHACTLDEGVVVADAAVVMDGAHVGAHALIAPGSLVPPRKRLPGGWVYAGNPATPVREIGRETVAEAARAIRNRYHSALTTHDDLPPLDASTLVPEGPFKGVLRSLHHHAPRVARAYVAPTAVVAGDVSVADDAGIYFGCVVSAGDGRIAIGERSNVQDNSILATSGQRGDLVIGRGVTIGHNVRLGSGAIHDRALIGMGSIVGDGVVVEEGGCVGAGARVEPGTVVRAGWIWAGRPARPFRELKDSERDTFARGCEVYVAYAAAYRAGESASQPGGCIS